MTTSANKPVTGEPTVLARYHSDEGIRQLVGQRIDGRVAVSDVPAGDRGRVYLIERHMNSMSELDGVVADYIALATELARPPMQSDWIFD